MKRKTIFIAIAAMAFIAFSCAREEVSVPAGEVAETEEVAETYEAATRSNYGYCYTCGSSLTYDGICPHMCDPHYIICNICGKYAQWGIGSICRTCNGQNPPVTWIDDDPDPRPKP